MSARVVEARYAGTCPACSRPITVGTMVALTKPTVHAACQGKPLVATAPSSMPARFAGHCSGCGAAFAEGSPIVYDRVARKVTGCAACGGGVKASAPIGVTALAPAVTAALARLTGEQRTVVEDWKGGYARLTAVAGSGKTASVSVLAGRLMRDGVEPARILVTSFTVKAAGEIRTRLADLFGAHGVAVTCGTFHSLVRGWLVEQLAANGDEATVRRIQNPIDGEGKADISKYDAETAKSIPKTLGVLAQRCLSTESLAPFLPGEVGLGLDDDPSPAFASDYLSAVGLLRASLIGPGDVAKIEERYPPPPDGNLAGVAAFYALLDRACRALGVSTFDEWLFLAAKLAVTDEAFALRIGSRFDWIVIDEAQDDNLAQLTLANAISSNGAGNLLLCGDVRQSIFGFRGAVPQFTVDLDKHSGREVSTYFLTGNFRSMAPIVELGNRIAKGTSWDFGPPAKAARPDAQVVPAEALAVWSPEDAGAEADEIAGHALEALADWKQRGASTRPIAVLSRTNAGLAAVEVALMRRKIPYTVTRGCGFWKRREAQAVVAYLRLAFGISADNDAVRVASSNPSRRLGRKFADAAGERIAAGLKPAAAIRATGEVFGPWRRGAAALAGAIEAIAAEKDVATAVQRAVLAVSGAFKGAGEEGGDDSRTENLVVLAEIAGSFKSVQELVDYSATGGRAKDTNGPEATVTLSTVHGAKGLEWDTVVIVGAVLGQFPHAKSTDDDEEQRIEYVACTRAARKLIVSAPQADWKGNETSAALCWTLAKEILDEGHKDGGPGSPGSGDGVTSSPELPADASAASAPPVSLAGAAGGIPPTPPLGDAVAAPAGDVRDATCTCGEAMRAVGEHGQRCPLYAGLAPRMEEAIGQVFYMKVGPDGLPPGHLMQEEIAATTAEASKMTSVVDAFAAACEVAAARTGTDRRLGDRYVEVRAAEVERLLAPLGFREVQPRRQQRVWEREIATGIIAIIYSSIPPGAETARELGEDSIRVALVRRTGTIERPLVKRQPWVARTKGWRSSLLDRLETVFEVARQEADAEDARRHLGGG